MTKQHIAVIYGGKNTEHQISLISAKNIVGSLNTEKYTISLIAIGLDGAWYLQSMPKVLDKLPTEFTPQRILNISMQANQARFTTSDSTVAKIDVCIPILHGINGEDGTVQGLLRCLNIPFLGCDVLSSAVCMDKEAMKHGLAGCGINTAKWLVIHAHEIDECDPEAIVSNLGLPLFIKPANAGSSVGVVKVTQTNKLIEGIREASQFDHKVLIEEMISGREIECPVLGNLDPKAAKPGEITTNPAHDFYSYDAKYLDDLGASLQVPADLTDIQTQNIQAIAKDAFRALHCEGMARVDCFLTKDDAVYVNEVNTIPGFTPISLYPQLWEVSGLSTEQLLDELINLALEKFDRQQSLRASY